MREVSRRPPTAIAAASALTPRTAAASASTIPSRDQAKPTSSSMPIEMKKRLLKTSRNGVTSATI